MNSSWTTVYATPYAVTPTPTHHSAGQGPAPSANSVTLSAANTSGKRSLRSNDWREDTPTPSWLVTASASGPVKPMAMSTMSAGISRSVPGAGPRWPFGMISVVATRKAVTWWSSSPKNSTVEARN